MILFWLHFAVFAVGEFLFFLPPSHDAGLMIMLLALILRTGDR